MNKKGVECKRLFMIFSVAYLIRVAFQVVNGRAMDGRAITVDTLPWQHSDMMVRVLEYISDTDYHRFVMYSIQ